MLPRPLYIHSMASIHPVFGKEPDYKEMIPHAGMRRRMSRIVRMGVAAGLECLKNSPVHPNAILTATGLGCLADTEKFMNNLLDTDEEQLSPSAFIQSTFNTIGAQIALLTGNHCYNNTYVHRIFSFESALLDASLLIGDGEAGQVLAGASDELTPTLHKIEERSGLLRYFPAGEGSAFFLLSGEASENSCAILCDVELFSGPYSNEETEERAKRFLAKNAAGGAHILRPETYKQYCGEYPTAMAFALWYACRYPEPHRYTLLYNSFSDSHSFILIKHIQP